ncbi:hypothetical protein HaLaN_18733, partial [Haematococcus lacustris]
TPAGTSLVAIQRHVAVTLATWDAVWGEYLLPKWAEQKMRLHGAQEKVLERYYMKLEEEPAQVQDRLLRSAWSKRFEAPVRGLMWCPWLAQATPGDLGKWVDRDCNAALNLQRAEESKWRPLELCRQAWPGSGAITALPVGRGCVICDPKCLHAASIRYHYVIHYPNPLAKAGQSMMA